MTKVREFVWNLAAAGHSAKAILQDVETAFHPKAMTLTQIYRIIKAYKEGRDGEDPVSYTHLTLPTIYSV